MTNINDKCLKMNDKRLNCFYDSVAIATRDEIEHRFDEYQWYKCEI